jgi:hypothetical protein
VFAGIVLGLAWPLKMGPIGCPEMSVTNYQIYAEKNHRTVRILLNSYLLFSSSRTYFPFFFTNLLSFLLHEPTFFSSSRPYFIFFFTRYPLVEDIFVPETLDVCHSHCVWRQTPTYYKFEQDRLIYYFQHRNRFLFTVKN